ncbi:hypothetical protein GCM10023167_10770 [Brevibacterium pityocampae]|uniref:Uncharacterized protein n=1 Tax=Brevibacterium pityocampae TaxID=506594 RepID=A0ABP8J962_9MICO
MLPGAAVSAKVCAVTAEIRSREAAGSQGRDDRRMGVLSDDGGHTQAILTDPPVGDNGRMEGMRRSEAGPAGRGVRPSPCPGSGKPEAGWTVHRIVGACPESVR